MKPVTIETLIHDAGIVPDEINGFDNFKDWDVETYCGQEVSRLLESWLNVSSALSGDRSGERSRMLDDLFYAVCEQISIICNG